MGIYNRNDGTYIKELPTYIKAFPFIMRRRLDASIYFSQKIDLTNTIEFSEKNNIKIFHIFLAALTKIGFEKENMNRFVVGKRIYKRNEFKIAFVAKRKLDEESEELSLKVEFDKKDNIYDVEKKVKNKVNIVKKGDSFNADKSLDILIKLPKLITTFIFFIVRKIDELGFLTKKFIDDNPLFVSVFVTNVGSIGLDAPFHHMFEFGTTSIFASLGKIHKDYIIDENENIRIADVVNVNFTIDERIVDGIYMAKSLELFKKYMENPSLLE
ncbi:2-oxo acid dehydrogenase subunit E2 [Helicovermis profundi]|uniref:2-oxoacid dehydrogenase acyltransferase catalytic domain-containing protein n=1 Tax=Helicovermis profundi TaxID=3065157 RepID=A0AAU9EGT6_9FIRM|nr:hypothetical protein HLPR_23030 [Clostridia bacterium S502]